MAGLYIHIPFCKQACHYCNFHFSTSLKHKGALIEAICKEIALQKDYLNTNQLTSVYFGGGTPSLLSKEDIQQIFRSIDQYFVVAEGAEITLEANPDDLNPSKLMELKATPINRLSIGIQSFHDKDLEYMNRAHNAAEALNCVQYAQENGFDNITIDLIYGTPTMTHEAWRENLKKTYELNINHVSCYALTVEPKTALEHFIEKGKSPKVEDEHTAEQFEILVEAMSEHGFEQYEISNFARGEAYAKHNTSYWKGVSYLGIGPSAHSFNGQSRQWNVANNALYIKSLEANEVPFEKEELTDNDVYNELIMTSLRTKWGIDINQLKTAELKSHFLSKATGYIADNKMKKVGESYVLTTEGKLLADNIMSDLFIVEDN